MLEIIITQTIVSIIDIYMLFTHKKQNVYITNFLFALFSLMMYMCKQDYATCIIYVFISVRAFVYLYRDNLYQHKLMKYFIPFLFITIQFIIGINCYHNWWGIIPTLAPAFCCFYLWFGNDLQMLRIGNIITSIAWFLYNLHLGLYIASISRIIVALAGISAYIKNRDLV